MEDEPGFGITYRLCPRCARAVPASSKERYCINDGEKLLEECPSCQAAITSPYTRFCAGCGLELNKAVITEDMCEKQEVA